MNILHAHLWGSPWVDDLSIFKLSSWRCKQLCEIEPHRVEKEIPYLWLFIENIIDARGPCFFKLSCTSPKDSIYPCSTPKLKGMDAQYVINVCLNSPRFIEELENAYLLGYDVAFILKKWNDDIEKSDEYRLFVGDGRYELAVNMNNNKIVGVDNQLNTIFDEFVKNHVDSFPGLTLAIDVAYSVEKDEIIFIEFNPIDDELDTYEVDCDVFSETIRRALASESETWKKLKHFNFITF
jgi:hypothetical protein